MTDNDFVVCELCGKRYKQISQTHLLKEHGITFADYKVLFPHSDTMARAVREKISESAKELNKAGTIGFKEGHLVNLGKTPWNKGAHGLQEPWSKGLSKETSPVLAEASKKVSRRRKEMFASGELVPLFGENNPMYGKRAWSSGKTKEDLPQLKVVSQKVSKTRKDKFRKGELKKLCGADNPMYGKKLTDEHKKALWRGWKPVKTKPELVVADTIKEYTDWHYVGDGKFFIKTKEKTRVPDFVNSKSKKIIEVYGDYWHKGQNPQDQIDEYKVVGWDCMVLWEHEVMADDFSIDRIKDFL